MIYLYRHIETLLNPRTSDEEPSHRVSHRRGWDAVHMPTGPTTPRSGPWSDSMCAHCAGRTSRVMLCSPSPARPSSGPSPDTTASLQRSRRPLASTDGGIQARRVLPFIHRWRRQLCFSCPGSMAGAHCTAVPRNGVGCGTPQILAWGPHGMAACGCALDVGVPRLAWTHCTL